MKIGSIVVNRKTGEYGTVHYSTWGVSIHTWDEERNMLGKTVGDSVQNVSKYWDVVSLPEGYEVCEHGGLVKKKN